MLNVPPRSLTYGAVERYAEIRHALRPQGQLIGDIVTLVAATAIERNLTILRQTLISRESQAYSISLSPARHYAEETGLYVKVVDYLSVYTRYFDEYPTRPQPVGVRKSEPGQMMPPNRCPRLLRGRSPSPGALMCYTTQEEDRPTTYPQKKETAMTATTPTAVGTDYEIVIGLEVHTQLLTQSKMFCTCDAHYADDAPNTHVCPVCMGMPGVLPVINQRAVAYTIMTGLALHCEIPELSKFDRKNYFYPDLPKGYQISQYDLPFCRNGWVEIQLDSQPKRIGITRAHLEEDTGRLLHRTDPSGTTYSLVDLNRAGIPLLEIVSEPDIRSPEEARLYMQKLRSILVYLGVSSGRMEEGSLRCDANISVRPRGQQQFGTKTEIKNMNSFRAVQRALEYEAERQIQVLRAGGRIVQETRGWVEAKGITVSQRTKEEANDYRYFPEPDLPPVILQRDWIEHIRAEMPELPDAKIARFTRDYGLSAYDAAVLTDERAEADYFEATVKAITNGDLAAKAKSAANWITGDLTRLLKAADQDIADCPITPAGLAGLINALDAGTISGKQAKDILERAFTTGEQPAAIIQREGIAQVSDTGALEKVAQEVIAANPKAVEDYRKGKTASAQFLIGQVMRQTKGSAKPDVIQPILVKLLDATNE
jgi:aspartyl-tRNA(Asn)/glutamyl-tRNA(Gln) amidotransferase subunit B